MRNRLVLSVLLLFAATGLLWAQFWKDFTDEQRQTVAQSYWLAGTQYQAVGQKEKGSDYMSLARVIDPQLDPSSISDTTMPSAAELLAQGRTTPIGAGAGTIPSGSLHSFFLRFVSALAEGNAADAAGFFDGSIYLTRVPEEMTRADAQAQLASFFTAQPAEPQTPSTLYDLSTAVIAPASPDVQKAWGETYTYSITAAEDHSSDVGFWETKQKFFIHKVGPDWFILAEGPSVPPLTWTPEKAAAVVTAPPAAATDAATSAAIVDSFQACMGAILNKDADGALAHMTDNINFLRLRQTVTKDELKTTLQGYFDKPDFGGASLSDALEADSIFVQPVESPVDDVTGTVYELNVRARTDLSDSIPFWSTYQKYYFVQEGGDWLIFAIL